MDKLRGIKIWKCVGNIAPPPSWLGLMYFILNPCVCVPHVCWVLGIWYITIRLGHYSLFIMNLYHEFYSWLCWCNWQISRDISLTVFVCRCVLDTILALLIPEFFFFFQDDLFSSDCINIPGPARWRLCSPDIEKVSILLQTRFVNNWNFHK